MIEKEKLKNCPYCGGAAWEYVENNALVCTCHKCKVHISRLLVPASSWEDAVIACRKAWNTRTESARPEGELSLLDRVLEEFEEPENHAPIEGSNGHYLYLTVAQQIIQKLKS